MKIRFNIGRKIGFGFSILIILTIVVFALTYRTLGTARVINTKINDIYNPSVSSLEQLKSTVLRSRTLVNMWAFVQSREDTKEKMTLVKLIDEEIPTIKYSTDSLSVHWTEGERRQKIAIYRELDRLTEMYSTVQSSLRDMQSYDDPMTRFEMSEYAEEDGLIFQQAVIVLDALNGLINEQKSNVTQDSITMIASFNTLESYLRNLGIALLLLGLIIAYFTVLSITKPVLQLKTVLLGLGKGKFPESALVPTGDEIGQMSVALEQLVSSLRRTTQFAYEVGNGNFDTEYEPLSDEDELGTSLLVMRDGLKEYAVERQRNEQDLERKVDERTREVVKQKNRIEKQNKRQQELLENIRASIRYAKRLQDNILPSEEYIRRVLPNSFIFFKPKDIVSGDFYFVQHFGEKVVIACVDCTGHGVPGAFMSLVSHNSLKHAISRNLDLNPAKILRDLSDLSAEALNRQDADGGGRDGMDIGLCIYDQNAEELEYCGAFNPLYIIRHGKLLITAPDKITIASIEGDNKEFTRHKIALEKGDMVYLFSDGYPDQFGGSKGRKFMYPAFRKLLVESSELPLRQQRQKLSTTFDAWRSGPNGILEQVDDILVIGIRHESA